MDTCMFSLELCQIYYIIFLLATILSLYDNLILKVIVTY